MVLTAWGSRPSSPRQERSSMVKAVPLVNIGCLRSRTPRYGTVSRALPPTSNLRPYRSMALPSFSWLRNPLHGCSRATGRSGPTGAEMLPNEDGHINNQQSQMCTPRQGLSRPRQSGPPGAFRRFSSFEDMDVLFRADLFQLLGPHTDR